MIFALRLLISNLLCIIYPDDIENNTKSHDPLINNGISNTIWLYVIHKADETIFIIENIKENILVDFLVYNKYIKIKRTDTEITVAVYATISSFVIFIIHINIFYSLTFCIFLYLCI